MKKLSVIFLFCLCSSSVVWSQDIQHEFPRQLKVDVTNPLTTRRENVMVFLPADQLTKAGFNPQAFVVLDHGKEIASQYNFHDVDYKGVVTVLTELGPKETRTLELRFKAEGTSKRENIKQTQAELAIKTGGKFVNREYIGGEFKNVDYLRVPPEHKDHSWFIRYEGPGLESDKVGYRLYLDQRNANDIFGKLTPEMVLQNVGLDGFESYHHLQSWGMDILKAGKSLGMASIASSVNGTLTRVEKTDSVDCRITQNGDVYSSILTNYHGWLIGEKKHDLVSRLSIHSGTRLVHSRLTVGNNPDNLATGLVIDKSSALMKDKGDKTHWGYLATYGKQSLNNDNLGIVLFFNPENFVDFTEDQFSYVVTFKPSRGKLDYYFAGAWEKEPGGIRDKEQFEQYIKAISEQLATPVTIKVYDR